MDTTTKAAATAGDGPFEWTPRMFTIARAVARKFARNHTEADELESEIQYAMVVAAPKWQPGGGASPETWLYRAALLTARREAPRYRKRLARTVSLDSNAGTPLIARGCLLAVLEDEKTPDPEGETLATEVYAKAMRRLSVLDRRMVRMRLDGHLFRDIGAAVGMTHQGAEWRYKKAIRRLRRSAPRWGINRGALSLAAWRAADPEGADQVRREGANKGRRHYAANRRRERAMTGWPELPAAQGRLMAWLAERESGDTAEAVAELGRSVGYVRNALSFLKARGLVERCGGGGIHGAARYRVTARAADGRERA